MLKYFIYIYRRETAFGSRKGVCLSDREGLDKGAVELANMAVQVS